MRAPCYYAAAQEAWSSRAQKEKSKWLLVCSIFSSRPNTRTEPELTCYRPCKTRKVKCDETRPICHNCQRQGEPCDYSIRLNWEGRGKKKAAESDPSGQIHFSPRMTSTAAIRPSNGESDSAIATSQMQFQDMSFGTKQEDGTPEIRTQSRHDLTFANQDSQQQQEPTQVLSSRPPSYEISMIDPALMVSLGSPAGMYADSVYGAMQGRPEPQYTQSYERYHSSTPSTPTTFHHSAGPRHRRGRTLEDANLAAEPDSGSRTRTTLSKKHAALTNAASPPSQLFFEDSPGNGDTQQQAASGFNKPLKRARYRASQDSNSLSPYDSTMPPPNITSFPGYSVDSQASSAIVFDSSSAGTPATPASSHGDDVLKDGYKPYPINLSSHIVQVSPDARRLSVNSLLSGPPGSSYQNERTYESENNGIRDWGQQLHDELDDITIYGIDRGFKDLDIGKNDDINAITGDSPRTVRDHLNHSLDDDSELVPMEFGFGMKENPAFESGAYYDKPVHVSIPRALEPLPTKLLENPMNLLVSVKCLLFMSCG